MSNYMQDEETVVELHDSEIMGCYKILTYLQGKYGNRQATYDNLMSLKGEAEELFGVIGLLVVVDWVGPTLLGGGGPPQISIVGRTTPFDEDRQTWEVRKGVADAHWDKKKA